MYPDGERFDGWREEFARRIINSDVRRLDDPEREEFYATSEVTQAGEAKIAISARNPIEVSRTARQAAENDGSLSLMINTKGGLQVSQDGVDTHHERRGAHLLYHDRVHQLRSLRARPEEMSHIVAVHLPRRALLAAAPEALARAGGQIAPNPAMLEYLIRYVTDIIAPAPEAPSNPALAAAVGDHILDLVALLLGPSRDAGEVASRRGLRAARLKSIMAFVGEHLSDPALDVSMVAQRHHIGTRYVSQLMEEKGETLTRCILRLRLEKAAAMLADPVLPRRRIGDIAFACGFTDLSHFNRSFRRHFGETPRSYRG